MSGSGHDQLKARRTLDVGAKSYHYYALDAIAEAGLGDIARLPYSLKVLLENLLRHENGRTVTVDDIKATAAWLEGRSSKQEIAFHPGAHLAAGLHRRACGGRSCRDAPGDGRARRRSAEDQPAGDGRSGDRPLGDGRHVRLRRGVPGQRQARVRAQPRALFVPPLGLQGVRQFPGRAAGHRDLPSGQPGIPRPDRVDPRGRRRDAGLSRHAGRHRQPHHDGQRPVGIGLGRRRHRGGGGDAGPADLDAAARGDRLQADRHAGRGHDRDGSGAHRHPDAACQGRGGQVRGVLRPRARRAAARRPGDDLQHGTRIRRDLRFFPDRWRDARLSEAHRARARSHRAGRGLCQGARLVARQGHAGPGVHRHGRARPRLGRALARRAQAAAGQGEPGRSGRGLRGGGWASSAAAAKRLPPRGPISPSRMAMW